MDKKDMEKEMKAWTLQAYILREKEERMESLRWKLRDGKLEMLTTKDEAFLNR